jgi:hypothetical protein
MFIMRNAKRISGRLPSSFAGWLPAAMEYAVDDDNEKSIVEQLVDKINSTVENITAIASEAAKHAMEPETARPSEQVVFVAMAENPLADPLMPPTPMMPVLISRKSRKARAKQASEKIPPTKATARKANKRFANRKAKRAVKTFAAKSGKTEPSPGRKGVSKKSSRNVRNVAD